jgi:hypothetical protein
VTDAGGPPALTRRRPQTHLAPELQRTRPSSPAPPSSPVSSQAVTAEALRAREALSRYQASRQAALTEYENVERNQT